MEAGKRKRKKRPFGTVSLCNKLQKNKQKKLPQVTCGGGSTSTLSTLSGGGNHRIIDAPRGLPLNLAGGPRRRGGGGGYKVTLVSIQRDQSVRGGIGDLVHVA